MEPETKKPKHEPTALHDAIVHVNHNQELLSYQQQKAHFCGEKPVLISDHTTTKALLNIFQTNRDAAMIKDANGNYPLYLIFCYRAAYLFEDDFLYGLVRKLLYHYPDALLQQCWDDLITTPLHFAAYHADHDLILLILNKNILLLNKLDKCKQTPLQVACSSKSFKEPLIAKAVETILQFSDININNIDNKGLTALFCSTNWRIISKLLQYPGVDVTVKNEYGESAFYLFLEYVNRMKYKNTKRSHVFGVVKMFMDCPGVLHLKHGNGQNILHVIVTWNNPHLLSFLLSYKNELWINWDQQADKRGETALHKACHYDGHDYLNYKKESSAYLECLNMLLSNIDDIATINRQNKDGDTALHRACFSKNHVAVKELLKIPGIDLTIFNKYGDTPLFYAFYGEDESDNVEFKCLRLLLNHNECLILARNIRGFRLPDLARNKLEEFSNGDGGIFHIPRHRRNDLMDDLKEFISKLDDYMAKARFKMFQCIHKHSHISYSKSLVSRT